MLGMKKDIKLPKFLILKVSLEGISTYYHPNGQIWKKLPYVKNQIEGTVEIYKMQWRTASTDDLCQGHKTGSQHSLLGSQSYCQPRRIFSRASLKMGNILIKKEILIAEVVNGTGLPSRFWQRRNSRITRI